MRGCRSVFLHASQFVMSLIILGSARHPSTLHRHASDFTGRSWINVTHSERILRSPNCVNMPASVGASRNGRFPIRLRGGYLVEDELSTFSQVDNQTDIATGETQNPNHGRFRLCVRRMDSQGGRDSDYRLLVPGDGPCRPFTEPTPIS
jgi:hypothetical protein